MNTGRSEHALCGLWCPTLTPMNADLSIDHGRLRSHVQEVLASGCHGVVLFGTTGEAVSFSVSERQHALEKLVKAGIEPGQLMIGTGCCAFPDTLSLSRHAIELDCRRHLVLPPFFYKGLEIAGIRRSYALLLDTLGDDDLELILYHFPALSGVAISPELIGGLQKDYPQIAGIKDSGGDWNNTRELLKSFPELAIFPGSEQFLTAALTLGGAGCISATANVNAAAISRAYDAYFDDGAAGDQFQQDIDELRGIFETFPLIAALKCRLAEFDHQSSWNRIRPPLLPLNQSQGSELRIKLKSSEFNSL